jgi:putative RNA 2'-phosphotransferase
MNDKQRIRISKFLSLILRHEPEKIGLQLDPNGWADIEALLAGCRQHGKHIERAELEEVVATNEKQRFAFSDDGQKIRANQGHSVEVSLGYEPQVPPAQLFHGTATRFLEAIRAEGLHKSERHHVHLSADEVTAHKVGQRHGRAVILVVKSELMHSRGYPFFLSTNGVWLTDHVPVEFLHFPDEEGARARHEL